MNPFEFRSDPELYEQEPPGPMLERLVAGVPAYVPSSAPTRPRMNPFEFQYVTPAVTDASRPRMAEPPRLGYDPLAFTPPDAAAAPPLRMGMPAQQPFQVDPVRTTPGQVFPVQPSNVPDPVPLRVGINYDPLQYTPPGEQAAPAPTPVPLTDDGRGASPVKASDLATPNRIEFNRGTPAQESKPTGGELAYIPLSGDVIQEAMQRQQQSKTAGRARGTFNPGDINARLAQAAANDPLAAGNMLGQARFENRGATQTQNYANLVQEQRQRDMLREMDRGPFGLIDKTQTYDPTKVRGAAVKASYDPFSAEMVQNQMRQIARRPGFTNRQIAEAQAKIDYRNEAPARAAQAQMAHQMRLKEIQAGQPPAPKPFEPRVIERGGQTFVEVSPEKFEAQKGQSYSGQGYTDEQIKGLQDRDQKLSSMQKPERDRLQARLNAFYADRQSGKPGVNTESQIQLLEFMLGHRNIMPDQNQADPMSLF